MKLEANHQEAVTHIRAVAEQGAILAVLPEYHLLNWVPKDPGFKDACSHWETYLTNYRDLAKELNISIVPGTILELHDSGTPEELLLNVAYFIDNTGAIAGRYVKKNLWGAIERDHLTSSAMEEHPVFDTPLGKVGMLICWDLAFPEAWRELIAKGAKMVIIPTFWTLFDCSEKGLAINPRAEALFLDSVLTARCFENTCGKDTTTDMNIAVVFANAGGPASKGYAGLSQICVPYAGPIAKMDNSAVGTAIADVDMQIVEDAEENYQVRADLARLDWHYDYRHSKDAKL
jgi:predicted amidohydrolase